MNFSCYILFVFSDIMSGIISSSTFLINIKSTRLMTSPPGQPVQVCPVVLYHYADVSKNHTGSRDHLPPWYLHGAGGQRGGGEAEGTVGGDSEGGLPSKSEPDSKQSRTRTPLHSGLVAGRRVGIVWVDTVERWDECIQTFSDDYSSVILPSSAKPKLEALASALAELSFNFEFTRPTPGKVPKLDI